MFMPAQVYTSLKIKNGVIRPQLNIGFILYKITIITCGLPQWTIQVASYIHVCTDSDDICSEDFSAFTYRLFLQRSVKDWYNFMVPHNNHLKLNISKTNKLVVDYNDRNMNVQQKSYTFLNMDASQFQGGHPRSVSPI